MTGNQVIYQNMMQLYHGSQKHLIKPPRDFVRAVVMHCVDVYTQVVLCPKNGDSCANVS